ncbi:class I adenylate-forming enzyme family protein [Streptomyces sp. NPDC048288]|uniref:class I adenylate-forming enzyme family protein n=1 Tax=Streptomyces sp. NPDC048288 TaxID=3365529 RepID=UPI00371F61ED
MWLHAEIRTLVDIPRYWAATTPDKVALCDGDRSLTYAELDERTDRLAAAIAAAGVAAGSRIGLLAKNSVEFFELWFGAAKAGCALVPLNWRCTAAELSELVADARPALLVAGAEFAEVAHSVCASVTPAVEVVVLDGSGLADWLGRHPGAPPAPRIHTEDTALVSYTSGTTGRPKGVELSHGAFANWFLISSLERTEKWTSDDVALMVMPGFHLAGSWVSLTALYHGGTIVIMPAFDPGALLAAIRRHRPTVTCLVPTAIALLLDHPGTASQDFSSLRRLLYAGSRIGPETLRRVITTFDCQLTQFYGTSETFIITLLRPEQHDPGEPALLTSCGAPLPLVDVRVVDAAGRALPPGEIGEVLVRSPMMFTGYRNQPEATATALTGGWYHTGDLGRLDGAGHLYLVDRLKDMIVTGGENVYPAEVERALGTHPGVAACAVVGAPDERWGERVVAHVVKHPGADVDEQGLLAHCRALIAGYKVPKQVRFTDALPMTSTGKIHKAALRAPRAGRPATATA